MAKTSIVAPAFLHNLLFLNFDLMVGLLKTFKSSLRARPSEPASSSDSSRPHGNQTGSDTSSLSQLSPSTPAWRRTRDASILFDDGHLSPASNKQLKVYGTELSHKFTIPNDALHAFVDVSFCNCSDPGFTAGLTHCKLSSPVHILMDLKAHLIAITSQDQKNMHAEWISSQECKVSLLSCTCCNLHY